MSDVMTCPYCGENRGYVRCATTDVKALCWCEACDKFSEWKRADPDDDWKSCEKGEE
jgi:hypothetical protein